MQTQTHPPSVPEIAAALRPIVQAGLPVAAAFEDANLLGLRGVHARSIDPSLRESRVKALDGLLRSQLLHFPSDVLGEAARVLFGIALGSRGTSLTERRGEAARLTNYDPDHFRRKVEPKIVQQLAWQLHQDSQNYIPRGRDEPLRMEPSGDTPVITVGDVSSKEYSERQEALSRLWAKVYELRAEILRVERLKTWPFDQTEPDLSREVLQQALVVRQRVLRETKASIESYINAYGESIEHGGGEFTASALLRLAGWSDHIADA